MSRTSKRNRRQSTPKQQQPAQPVAAATPEPLVVPEVTWQQDADFGDVEDFETGWADERQLRLLMKDWRKACATCTVWDMITDGYVTIFSLVVVIAMVVSGIMSVQQSAAGCSDTGCTTARGLLPWMTLMLVVMLGLAASKVFGPVIASAAEGFWLLDAPIRRSKILSRRLVGVVVGAFIAALLAGLIGMLTGLSLEAVGVWALASGAVGAAVVAFSAFEQTAERTIVMSILQAAIGVAATGVLVVMVAVSRGWIALNVDPMQTERLGHLRVARRRCAACRLRRPGSRGLNKIRAPGWSAVGTCSAACRVPCSPSTSA